jgi:hypothetical protein
MNNSPLQIKIENQIGLLLRRPTMSQTTQKLYISSQQTQLVLDTVLRMDEKFEVKTSAPEFNIKNRPSNWNELKAEEITCPTFGPSINDALAKILNEQGLRRFLIATGTRLPSRSFGDWWLSRLGKMEKLYSFLDQHGCKESTDRIKSFLAAAKSLDFTHMTQDLWNSFLSEHLPADWQYRVHYTKALQMFGVSDEVAALVQTTMVEGRNQTLAHYSLRVLTGCICCHKLGPGCMTDIVNGIHALMRHPAPDNTLPGAEQHVVQTLEGFLSVLQHHQFADLWVPDYHLQDGENDDMIISGIFNYIRYCTGLPQLKTIVQLPYQEEFRDLMSVMEYTGLNVFMDTDSENAKALQQYWFGR